MKKIIILFLFTLFTFNLNVGAFENKTDFFIKDYSINIDNDSNNIEIDFDSFFKDVFLFLNSDD